MRVQNGTGGTLNSVTLNYTGEQWRDGSAPSAAVLTFQFSTNATSLLTGIWNNVSSLDFNSVSNVGAGAINGNLAINEAFPSGTVNSLNWLNGTDVWVRWLHVGNQSRHALALDEVHLSAQATPEPSTLVACGLGAVWFAQLGRQKRS